jgi:TRAP-type C4-dicarboxylate transport system substrate-binding protein
MKRVCLVVLAACVLPALATAQSGVRIRMASLAPDGSVWDRNLRQMGAEWQKASKGAVTLNVFPGGQLGDDSKVVSSLRAGRPEAAALTVVGLSKIDAAFGVFSLPFFFDSYDELYAVIEKMTPALDERLAKNGLTRVAWGNGGWVRIFSREPIRTLADLKRVKLFTSAGEDDMLQWYKDNGFSPVPLAMTDILTGLTTGQIDAMPTTPTAALAFQWYNRTPNMLDLGVAPLVGAVVVSTPVWQRVPADVRATLERAGADMDGRLRALIPAQDEASVAEMQKRGLKVHKPEGTGWQETADSAIRTIRGGMVPADIYDLAKRERDAFRARRRP